MTSTQWAMYDTISGDILERGSESWVRKVQRDAIDAAAGGPCPLAIGTGADVRRAQKAISRGMAANPPRDLSRCNALYLVRIPCTHMVRAVSLR